MKLSSLIPFALLAGVIAQNPVEVYQRWLMIIKPVARAGGAFNGDLTQDDIDQATFAFKDTWPRTIRELTGGRVMIESQVEVSEEPVTSYSRSALGMVGPEDIPNDVKKFNVTAENWDGVAVYNAFTEHAYWGNVSPGGVGVGWFSVQHCPDLSYGSDPVAGWIHEALHTMGWYYADERLGPTAPSCDGAENKRDGTHCGGAYGYTGDAGMGHWYEWYKDYLLGKVAGNLGLGSAAWKFGSRREAALGLKPGSLIPGGDDDGPSSTSISSPSSTSISGPSSTSISGPSSTGYSGPSSTSISGPSSTSISGPSSTGYSGPSSTSISGPSSTSTSSSSYTNSSGPSSTSISGPSFTDDSGPSSTSISSPTSTNTGGQSSSKTSSQYPTETSNQYPTKTRCRRPTKIRGHHRARPSGRYLRRNAGVTSTDMTGLEIGPIAD